MPDPNHPSAPERVAARVFEWAVRLLVRWYVDLEVDGTDRLPADGGYLVVANHASHLDAAVLMATCGGRFDRFHFAAAGDYFFGRGRFGWLLRTGLRLEAIPRGGDLPPEERARAIDTAFARLRASCSRGDVVVLFPEGTRTVDGSIGPFRRGVERLAAGLDRPVVPIHVEGTYALWPRGRRWTRRGSVWVVVGEPVPLAGRVSTDGLAGELRRRVLELGATSAGPTDAQQSEEPRTCSNT